MTLESFTPNSSFDDGYWITAGVGGVPDAGELLTGKLASPYSAWVRFPNVTIPAGATVNSAWLSVVPWFTQGGSMAAEIYCWDYDSIVVSEYSNSNSLGTWADTRDKTTESVLWSIANTWTTTTSYGSPDFKNVVQEVVDRGGWASGNALAVVIQTHQDSTGYGSRRVRDWDHGSSTIFPTLFVDYTITYTSAPDPGNTFLIDTSDYTDRVLKYGKILRTAKKEEVRSGKITVELDNTDKEFNDFYTNLHTTAGKTGYLKTGFTDSGSYNPSVRTVFTGDLAAVEYNDAKVTLTFRDIIHELKDKVVGSSDDPVTFSNDIPSDIAETLCTCYGGLTFASNIDSGDFYEWAEQFSNDSITCDARYTGQKVTKALASLCLMNASVMYCEGDGTIHFKRFTEADSNDTLMTEDDYTKFSVDVQTQKLINTQWVFADFKQESDFFNITCNASDGASVNSYGVHENVYQDKTVWFPSSAGAINRAQREVFYYSRPPRMFDIKAHLFGINRELGETIRLTNSFFSITSESAYRIDEWELNLNTGAMRFGIDTATSLRAIYLYNSGDANAYVFGVDGVTTAEGEDARLL